MCFSLFTGVVIVEVSKHECNMNTNLLIRFHSWRLKFIGRNNSSWNDCIFPFVKKVEKQDQCSNAWFYETLNSLNHKTLVVSTGFPSEFLKISQRLPLPSEMEKVKKIEGADGS